MSETLKPCPFCGSEKVRSRNVVSCFWVECDNEEECGAIGPEAKSAADAAQKWNAAPRREEGEK